MSPLSRAVAKIKDALVVLTTAMENIIVEAMHDQLGLGMVLAG